LKDPHPPQSADAELVEPKLFVNTVGRRGVSVVGWVGGCAVHGPLFFQQKQMQLTRKEKMFFIFPFRFFLTFASVE